MGNRLQVVGGLALAGLLASFGLGAPALAGTTAGTGVTLNPMATPAKLFVAGSANVTLRGKNFGAGSTVTVSGSGVRVVGAVFSGSANAASATLNLAADAAATPGLRDLTLTAANGSSATCQACLAVLGVPTVDSVSPSSRARGTTLPVSLSGSGFVSGLHVYVSGGGFMVKNLVTTPSLITFNLQISPGTDAGLRTIQVKNPDGGIGTATITFT